MRPIIFRIVVILSCAVIFFLIGGCGKDSTGPEKGMPEVRALVANPARIYVGQTTTVTCTGYDPDGSALTFAWTAEVGTLANANTSAAIWTAPATAAWYKVKCTVTNSKGSRWGTVNVEVVTPPPLLARWPFDADFTDVVGGNNGTPGAGTTITTADKKIGAGAAQFTSAEADLTGLVSAGTALGMNEGDDFGVTLWIKTTDVSGFLFGRTFNGNFETGAKGLFINDEGFASFWGRRVSAFNGETPVNDDQWHFIALVKNGLNITIYVDGNVDAEGESEGWREDGESTVTMGAASRNGESNPGAYSGLLDDVRFYGRAMTDEEVVNVMNETAR